MKFRANQFLLFLLAVIISMSCSEVKLKTEYYPSGKVSMKYEENKGMKNGHYISFFENGFKRSEGNYRNNQQTGFWTTWYQNGNISTEGKFNNGLQTGIWRFYYENGVVHQIDSFNNDKRNGAFFGFDINGKLAQKGFAINDMIEGVYYLYYPNGKMCSETNYKNGQANGVFIEYYENGNLKARGTSVNDSILIGDFIQYDSINPQKYSSVYVYENDRISDTTKTFEKGKLIELEIRKTDGTVRIVKVQ